MTAGTIFSSQPVLFLQDTHGNGVPSTSVTLSLFTDSQCLSGAGSVGLTGNSASTNASGFAVFSSFQATKVGVYYVKATSTGSVATGCSAAALTVTNGALNNLSFSTHPGGSVAAGVALTTQPVVYAMDLYGNAVPSASVTLSAFTDSGCAAGGSGTLSNGVEASNSTGYAAFALLSYTRTGTIYLKASSGICLQIES